MNKLVSYPCEKINLGWNGEGLAGFEAAYCVFTETILFNTVDVFRHAVENNHGTVLNVVHFRSDCKINGCECEGMVYFFGFAKS